MLLDFDVDDDDYGGGWWLAVWYDENKWVLRMKINNC